MAEYIEKEAAYALSKKICDAFRNREYHPATFGHLILDWIDDLPAADVAPVRHGRWIETTQPMGWDDVTCAECSECGEDFVLDEWGMDDMKNLMHYCPNCGCRMDLEDKNG